MKLTKLIQQLHKIIDENGEMDVEWREIPGLLLCLQYTKKKGFKGIYIDLKEEKDGKDI